MFTFKKHFYEILGEGNYRTISKRNENSELHFSKYIALKK